jgi:choline-sulfatase
MKRRSNHHLGRVVAFFLGGLLGLSAVACTSPGDPPVHVVLVVIDTLRADRLGIYGSQEEITPGIDAVARESAVFAEAIAPAPWTLPSVASLLTSTHVCEHAAIVDGDKVATRLETLAERLRRAGYQTASFYANPYAGAMSGLDRGYDSATLSHGTNGQIVGAWLDARDEAPFFVYVHNAEPHDPYGDARKSDPIRQRVSEAQQREINQTLRALRLLTRADHDAKRAVGNTDNTEEQQRHMSWLESQVGDIHELYASDVGVADRRIASVVQALRERRLWEDTLFILVSDHGEEFGEHEGWHHDQSLYQELIHVPLLIHFPRGQFAGLRLEGPVSLLDVVPTIFDYLGRPELAAGSRGESLLPRLRGEREDDPERLWISAVRHNRKKYYRPDKESRGDLNISLRQGSWKAIWNAEVDSLELYDLSRDPGETNDLRARYPERREQMRRAAESWLLECRQKRSRS